MRFRSGTLDRSVKRFGRVPNFRKFQRVQHSWKYVDLEEQSLNVNGATVVDIVIAAADDWVLSGTANGVKNMTMDLGCALTWAPEISAIDTFNQWRAKWGLFCLDNDDVGGGINGTFAETRALAWGVHSVSGSAQPTGTTFGADVRQWNFKVKARQRWMKFDEEIRFKINFDSDVGSVISDARVWIFGRVSWEVP